MGAEAGRFVRVAFDSRPSAEIGGISRYARCLLQALRETASERQEVVETHHPRHVDVYHSPWMQGAMLRSPCPMVVTLHNLAALRRRSEHLRMAALPRLRHLAVQRAAQVIVPTAAVAADAIERLDLDAERIVVIPEAPDPALRPRAEHEVAGVRRRLGLPERYLLWVGCPRGADTWRQVARVASAQRELPLVVAGPAGPWARELTRARPAVTLTGRVSDDDLSAIYGGAHALVAPSEDGKFGLPAVEALTCGTPVAAFDLPALREVLGERAALVPAGDFDALINLAERLRRPAPAPPAWRWQDAGRATWRVYERALQARDRECLSLRRISRRRQAARS